MRVLRSAALAALLAAQLGGAARAEATDAELYAPLLDALERPLAAALDDTLPRYRITATLSPVASTGPATISGSVELDYVNTSGGAQRELDLRLYPNTPEYGDGGMRLDDLSIDDEPATGAQGDPAAGGDATLLTIRLAAPLAEGGRLTLAATFVTTVPTDLTRSYGMFEYDSVLDTYALAHWFPMLAGIDPDGSWLTDPPSENGDPVFSNAALFDVELTAPTELVIATSGSESGLSPAAEVTTHHYVSGPSRDFVMAASAGFEVIERRVGETTVRSYTVDGFESGNEAVLAAGSQALEVYGRLFGDYLYDELDLIQIPLGGGAGGVEFPGILYIGADYYDDTPEDEGAPDFLEFVVAHEVGHQWWYGAVGNDQYRHAFLDEGLTNYLTTVYFAEQHGAAAGEEQVNHALKLSYFNLLFNRGDQIVDQPTDAFPSANSYGATIYGKGALGFGAIRAEIGDEAFFGALRAYYADLRFRVATPADLLAAFEQAAGEQLDELWRHWFEAAEGGQDYDESDLADLLVEIGR